MYPQSLHITKVENPLLFKNNIVCFLFFKFSSISSCSFWLIIERLPFASSFLKSTISIVGRLELFALFVNSIIFLDLLYVVISGVALPSTNGISFFLAIYLAISFALYFGDISDLYDESCSSSIIIIPKFFIGAKIADLAPISILYLSSFKFFHCSFLSPIDNLLCKTAIQSPNLARNLSTI